MLLEPVPLPLSDPVREPDEPLLSEDPEPLEPVELVEPEASLPDPPVPASLAEVVLGLEPRLSMGVLPGPALREPAAPGVLPGDPGAGRPAEGDPDPPVPLFSSHAR